MVESESDSENECLAAIEKKLKTVKKIRFKETTANSESNQTKTKNTKECIIGATSECCKNVWWKWR